MAADRITRIEIEGLRSIERLSLDLDGLCVLIGEAGSGKSSIVEACAILRSIPNPDFLRALHAAHGGPHALVNSRAGDQLRLVAWIAPSEPAEANFGLKYELVLSGASGTFSIATERLWVGTDVRELPLRLLERVGGKYRALDRGVKQRAFEEIPQDSVALALHARRGSQSGRASREAQRMLAALERIEVQLPFDTTPSWAGQVGSRRRVALRASQTLEPARQVALFGENLASVYHELKNAKSGSDWAELLDVLRLGLGADVQDVIISAEAGASVQLFLKYVDQKPIPASALSDGTLSYLAFTALRFLASDRTLLVFDEPELHLHPHLLVRVLDLLQDMATHHPVLISTHSDRLLDALENPETSTRLLELDAHRATRIRKPDAAALAKWLEEYRGLGRVRAEGYVDAVFERPAQGDPPA